MSGEEIALVEVGVVVAIAFFLGFVFSRFKQNAALGYIVAGILLGPIGFNYLVPGHGLSQVFGEMGLLLLMFYLGLELHLKHFVEHGAPATVLAAVEMFLTFAAGFLVARLLGFSDVEALVIGAVMIATSTAIVGKFLIDRHLFSKPSGRLAHAILVLQDFSAILLLVFISSVAAQKSFNSVALTALFFVVSVFFVVARFSRKLLAFLGAGESRAGITLYAIAVGILVAWLAAFLGLPSTLGAYFTGFALSETAYGKRIKEQLGLLREFFVLFFFVSFGSALFFDSVAGVVVFPPLSEWVFLLSAAALLALAYLAVKLFTYGVFGVALGFKSKTAVGVGFLLLPLGEFAVIIALASKPLLDAAAFNSLLPLTFLLILFTASLMAPLFDRASVVSSWLERFYPAQARKKLSLVGRELRALQRFSAVESKTFVGRALLKLAVNFLAVLAVVYVSNAIGLEAGLPSGGLQVPLSAVVLLFVLWPLRNLVRELVGLAVFSAKHLLESAGGARFSAAEKRVVSLLAGSLVLAGGMVSFLLLFSVYSERVFVWVVPIAFSVVAGVELACNLLQGRSA
ncbi:MAG: cation:proton antiporter [Candidatus Micrarchaeia archaeon]